MLYPQGNHLVTHMQTIWVGTHAAMYGRQALLPTGNRGNRHFNLDFFIVSYSQKVGTDPAECFFLQTTILECPGYSRSRNFQKKNFILVKVLHL